MMKNDTLTNQVNKKISLLLLAFIIILLIIASRLFYLQIYLAHHLFTLSQRNFTRMQATSSPRGNIVDANGILLATNRPIINVYWKGSGNIQFNNEQQTALYQIEAILNSMLEPDKQQAIRIAEKQSKTILLASDLSFEQLSKFAEQFASNGNILITTHFKRFYPYNNVACHILGYLNQTSLESMGKMGLEQIFEDALKGESGSILRTINAVGQHINEKELKRAIAGKTIQTTLDLPIQTIAEEVFPPDIAGSIIILDPETGDIKALVSRPNFDPNIFLGPMSQASWQELQEKKPFLNRAFSACYPPASIFKLVTLSSAYEIGLVDQTTKTCCRGYTRFGGRDYHCKRHEGHGLLTIKESLAQSCNILFFELGKRININTLADYAKRFGLGQNTGLIFAEKEGVIPTTAWKFQHKGEPWWPGETLSAVIGQSFLLVTPIQIACMISSIFTGYLVKPRILATEAIEKKDLNIQKETLKFLRRLMKKVVKMGTGRRVGRIRDMQVYAKTGTAQTAALGKETLGGHYLEHAWFAGYFHYKNNKPLTMVIMLEHVGSATPALQTASSFLVKYRRMLENSTMAQKPTK